MMDKMLIVIQARIQGGGRWSGRPPLGWSFTMQDTLFNSIQAPVRHWAPSPGRNPASVPVIKKENNE